MSNPKKPVGSLSNAQIALAEFLRKNGQVEGSGWTSAKSWAKQLGMYDDKGGVSPLGQRYADFSGANNLTLRFMAVNAANPEVKEQLLEAANGNYGESNLDNDELAMIVGYTVVKFRSMIIGAQATTNLDSAAQMISVFSGLSSHAAVKGLEQLARHGLCELWRAAPPYQLTNFPKSLTEHDFVMSYSGMDGLEIGAGLERAKQRRQEYLDEEKRIQEQAERERQAAIEAFQARSQERRQQTEEEVVLIADKKQAVAEIKGLQEAERNAPDELSRLEAQYKLYDRWGTLYETGLVPLPDAAEGYHAASFFESMMENAQQEIDALKRQPKKPSAPSRQIGAPRSIVKKPRHRRNGAPGRGIKLVLTIRQKGLKVRHKKIDSMSKLERIISRPANSDLDFRLREWEDHLEERGRERQSIARRPVNERRVWVKAPSAPTPEPVPEEKAMQELVETLKGIDEKSERAIEKVKKEKAPKAEKPPKVEMRLPSPPPPIQASVELPDDDAAREEYAGELSEQRKALGRRSTNVGARDQESIREGIKRGKALLLGIATSVAAAAQELYGQFAPSKVMQRDPIGVEAAESGNTFYIRVTGGPEAQMWAKILEDGTQNPVDLLKVARLSQKRRAVQIYRAKRGKGGRLIKRAKNEATPGYYITVPFVYGRATRGADGRIDVTEVFKRKRYNASGKLVDASLYGENSSKSRRNRQRRVLDEWAGTPMVSDDPERYNELDDDPSDAYGSGRFYEQQRDYDMDAVQYDMDGPTNLNATGRGPGKVITRDEKNNRLVVSEYGSFAGSQKAGRQRTPLGNRKYQAESSRLVRGPDGSITREHYVVPQDSPEMGQFETNESAELSERFGGRVQFRPSENGEGDLVRFRRISTRGTAPLNNIPPNPRLAKHILRNAKTSYAEQVAKEIAELERKRGTKAGLTIAQQATLATLNAARNLL